MKKIYILFVVMFLLIVGCGTKKAISEKKFNSIATKEGYVIKNDKSSYKDVTGVQKAFVAYNKNGYKIEVLVFDNEEYAKTFFDNAKQEFSYNKEMMSEEKDVNSSNYQRYSLTGHGYYMNVSKIENKVLIAKVQSVFEKDAKALIDKLGY